MLQKLTRGLPHARPVRGALELVPAALRHELVRMRVHRDLDAFDSLFRGNKVHRCRGRGLLNNTSPHNQSLRDRQRDTWVSKWSCLAAADGAPRVGQPGWAVWTRPPALYSPWREPGVVHVLFVDARTMQPARCALGTCHLRSSSNMDPNVSRVNSMRAREPWLLSTFLELPTALLLHV